MIVAAKARKTISLVQVKKVNKHRSEGNRVFSKERVVMELKTGLQVELGM